MTDNVIIEHIIAQAIGAFDRANVPKLGTDAGVRAAIAAAIEQTAMQVNDWDDPAYEMHEIAHHIRRAPEEIT